MQHGNTYARTLVNAKQAGKIYTYLPKDIKHDQVDFLQSVDLKTGIRIYDETRDVIWKFVTSFLNESNNRIALIETYYHPGNISKLSDIPAIVLYNTEVYFLLKSKEKLAVVVDGFSSARDYPFICGLIDLNNINYSVQDGQDIPKEWWETFVHKTQFTIVGAYDDEGYLIGAHQNIEDEPAS